MKAIWTDFVLPFLMSYGMSLLSAIIVGIVIGFMGMLGGLVKKANVALKNLADKYLTEKISLRVNEALSKVEIILLDLISVETNTIKEMAKKAMEDDGKIDMAEVKEISKKVAENALARLASEKNTLQKFIVGENITAFLEDKVTAIISQTVEKLISNSKLGK